MIASDIKTAYLNFVNDHLEVIPYGSGFMVWVPIHHSDDDAVSLSVEPHNGGWLVTDQGSTLTRLQSTGALLDSDRFRDAWQQLGRPGHGFIPGDDAPMEIRAWGSAEDVGRLLVSVGEAALRAEGLSHMVEPKRAIRSFGERVAQRVLQGVSDRATVKPNGTVPMTSGRVRRVTATIERGGAVIGAVQAIGGQNRQDRQRSHDVAYAIFGPSKLAHDQRLAVAIGAEDGWDQAMIRELRDVADVHFFNDPKSMELDLDRLLENA